MWVQSLASSVGQGARHERNADVAGRIIAPPSEVQVGVMTALIGVPVFIALIRTRKQVGL